MKLSNIDAQRFWAQVARGEPEACWLWLGKTAYVVVNGTGCRVHRVAYALEKRLPTGRPVLHTCDNRRCCNPRHLRLGRGRHRLTEQQIAEIRALKGQSLRTIARAYGVSHEFIRQLRAGTAR
jgi:HNH endonuclease